MEKGWLEKKSTIPPNYRTFVRHNLEILKFEILKS